MLNNINVNTRDATHNEIASTQIRDYIEDMLGQLSQLAAANGLSEMSSMIDITHRAVKIGRFDDAP